MRILFSLVIVVLLSACATQGELKYVTAAGVHKTACATEYSGAPTVDQYAVEYILSYCAQKVLKQGHQVLDKALLNIDLAIPPHPNGEPWSFEAATKLHQAKQLTDQEYGYIIAYLDLGLDKPATALHSD